MEKEKFEVVFRPKASDSIDKIVIYIEENGYPETAIKFSNKLYKFAYSLTLFPNKYAVCRHPQFAKRNYHCAVFHKNYIFVYKLVKNHLVIYNIIHCNTNPVFHSV
ncbi:MAG: hypothetical protein A2275_13105 [Bacteroidetes bacterium RIFOXYA12_FULL_35_11]|nr:MAG: hypothetical protein A2X01_19500 [Bacteroidetes bacterium GWF2_35_48]OFY74832.1 MAG: hypothetical protein A2275_13105 [Bacteroidetes bacterium RIFOXYA12_FULL_35_11]